MKKIKNLLIVLPVIVIVAVMSFVACQQEADEETYNNTVNVERLA